MCILDLLKKDKTEHPLLALAPMAGVSDLIFRTICENFGADYSVTEMLASAPQLIHSQKNNQRINFVKNSHVKIIQIIGNNPKEMANAAAFYQDQGIDIIDINLGCPARKISKKGAGSALLKDLSLCRAMIESVQKATPKTPITIKTRLGWYCDQTTIFELHKIAEDLGIQMLTVHGRSGEDKFRSNAQFDLIAKLKQVSQIPIIANGDINSVDKAKAVLEYTKCDGIMIGRGAIGKPWLFYDISQSFKEKKPLLFSETKAQLQKVILDHIQQIHQNYPQKGVILARKHIKNYLFEMTHSDVYFKEVAQTTEPKIQLEQLKRLLTNSFTTNNV